MSNVFESWITEGAQRNFTAAWNVLDGSSTKVQIDAALALTTGDAARFINTTSDVLWGRNKQNVDVTTGVSITLIMAADANGAGSQLALWRQELQTPDKKLALYNQIVGLWHTFARGHSPSAAGHGASATGDDTFKILANGDVVIQDKAGKVIATAQSRSTITESDFQNCHNMKTDSTKESCVKYLAFVAGVGTATDRVALDFKDLGMVTDNQPADLHAQVAHAYAVLKRVNWYAHTGSEDAFAYTFEDFSVEERKEPSLQKALGYMLNPAALGSFGADLTGWASAVKDTNLTNLGKLVKACYTLVNNNPAIKNAIVEQQRFSPAKVRTVGPLARMTSLKGPMRTLHGMYAAPGHSSHVLLPAMMGAGQVGGGSSTAAGLRAKLDGLLPVLAQNNKRLSAESFAAFTKKLNTLEAYEKDVQDFMHRLRNVDTDKLNTVASPVVNDTDIVAFEKKSQAVTRATAVLSNALGNIAHYGRPIIIQNVAAPAAPTAASSGQYTL